MEKRKKTLLILGLCIFTLALVGLSYAFWQITLQQTDENVVYTDCLKLKFTDENAISLQNAYPMTYEEQESFFESETPYHFTIKNECNSKANLSINIETLPVEVEKTKLDDEWVDVILYEGKEDYIKYVRPVLNTPEYDDEGNEHYKVTANQKNDNKLLSNSIDAYNLYNFTIDKGATKDFSMYLFLDEDTPYQTESGKKTTNAEWKGKVTINAAYRIQVKNMIRKIADDHNIFEGDGDYHTGDYEGMWRYKDQITKIVFKDTLDPPENNTSELTFDESDYDDGSVMSYLVPNVDEEGTYTAYIQANGKIIANYDSSYLFDDFINVTSIEGLENFDTSKVTNMSKMFSGMFSLTTLDLSNSNFDTSNVTDMSYMFSTTGLTTLNLGSQFDTSKVTNMSNMFSSMYSLTILDLSQSNFDTRNVTNMSEMFTYMETLTTLTLGEKFDTSKVTDMSNMFSEMISLTTLNLGNHFDTSQVTNMSNMFENMMALTALDLSQSNFDTSNVTDMNSMFYRMNSLETLELGNQFDTSKVTDMRAMFSGISLLTELNLPESFDTSQVTNMYGMFSDTSFTTLDLSQGNFDTSQVTDMSVMFSEMSSLTELNLPESFDTSKVTNMRRMFYGLSSLETMDLSQGNFNTSQVTDMNSMFSGMSSLDTLDLSQYNFDTSQVTDMNSMFSGMSSLTTLNLGDHFDTSKVTDMRYMFSGNTELNQVDYGDYFVHKDGARTDDMFSNCPEELNKPTDPSWASEDWYTGE